MESLKTGLDNDPSGSRSVVDNSMAPDSRLVDVPRASTWMLIVTFPNEADLLYLQIGTFLKFKSLVCCDV